MKTKTIFAGIAIVCALGAAAAPQLYMAGDSIMTEYRPNEWPQYGWGQALKEFMKEPSHLHNFARSGWSARRFRESGRWEKCIASKLKPSDWVIVSFGHNDSNTKRNKPPKNDYSTPEEYKAFLAGFVADVKAKGANIAFATSIAHSDGFSETDGAMCVDGGVKRLGPYVAAMREAAAKLGVPLLDLNRYAEENLPKMGMKAAKSLYMFVVPGEYANYPKGKRDAAHIRDKGAFFYAKGAVEMARKQGLSIADLWKDPAGVPFVPSVAPASSVQATVFKAVSPDGLNELRLEVGGKGMAYSVWRRGKALVVPTRFSMAVDGHGWLNGIGATPKMMSRKIDGKLATPIYKKSEIDFVANETRVDFGEWAVVLHARNDGVAWRFETAFGGEITIPGESTGVRFPKGAELCYTQEEGFMSGWEKPAKIGPVESVKPGHPQIVMTPFTATVPGAGVVTVMESNLLDYPGLNFYRRENEPDTLRSWQAGVPKEVERHRRKIKVVSREPYLAKTSGTRTFPWRVFVLGDTPSDLVSADTVYALAEPSRVKDASWVKPGQVAWDWWNGFKITDVPGLETGCNFETYKEYVNFAAANGIPYIIMDEGWSEKLNLDKPRAEVNVPGVIAYAKEKGVGVILWAAWSPLTDRETRLRVFDRYAALGAKGFKIDFIERDDQIVEKFLEETAADAAERKLVVMYHGIHKPTGLCRTYPNVLNYEGVYGLEQGGRIGGRKVVISNDVNLVYTRMVAGAMDYTPGAMRNRAFDAPPYDKERDIRACYGTRCHQLALFPLFEAPIQMLCDSPTQYRTAPECAAFITSVPTVWDETVGVAGEIGKFAAVARRKGGEWWLGAISNWDARDVELPTDFLCGGEWTAEVFEDAPDADVNAEHYVRRTVQVKAGEPLKVHLARGGGFAAHFTRKHSVAVCSATGLMPYGKFADGLLSRTRPTGWLGRVCRLQADGLTGHPEALSYPYDTCLWAGIIPRMGTHGQDWWRYEQTAYYTDGLLRLGYALGDRRFIDKGEVGVSYTLDNASPEGYLGSPCLWDAKNFKLKNGYDMWPLAVFFRAMKAKYDASPDKRIPAALARHFLLYDKKHVSEYRNIINVEGMLWAYARTGERRLLEIAEEAWRMRKPLPPNKKNELAPENCANDDAIHMHGVSYCEEMKVPMLLAAYTGKKEYLDQAVNVERKLVRDHMLPDGCPSSTERVRGNSVHWGHETCDVADYTWSLGYFLEATGDASYADKIERCVFNAGFGAIADDFRSLQYFSNPNQFICTSNSDNNPHCYGTTWMQYRPTHETECCAGNVHRIVPNYVSRMWLKDAKGRPVAALYGPSEVDFGWAKIKEETHYPFDGKIAFRFSMKEPHESAFTYRVPVWCRNGASVKVNGESVVPAGSGKFATIERKFADGDVIELDFPMETVFEPLPHRFIVDNKDMKRGLKRPAAAFADASQGTVVTRGPLLFAYPIPAERTEDAEEHANMNGKKSANPEFKCWNLRPAGSFNYALAEHRAEVVAGDAVGDGFFKEPASVKIRVPVRRIEWSLDENRFTPDIPECPVVIGDALETIDLVPYGATMLRLGAFPDVASTRAHCVLGSAFTAKGVPLGSLAVMTYNIRTSSLDKETDNSWEARREALAQLVESEKPDVVGFQEVLPDQRAWLEKRFPQYAFSGCGRNADRASGEASPVAYRKERFVAVTNGTFWLSTTPDEPGSMSWGAKYPRVCTWAVLEDKAGGGRFSFANTHTDHKSEEARERGMLLIIERMKEFGANAPIVLVGDHNCLEFDRPSLAVKNLLNDALYLSSTPPEGSWRTCNHWVWIEKDMTIAEALEKPIRERSAKGNVSERIDYVYVSPGTKVSGYRTISAPRPGTKLFPSDHFPTVATIVLPR